MKLKRYYWLLLMLLGTLGCQAQIINSNIINWGKMNGFGTGVGTFSFGTNITANTNGAIGIGSNVISGKLSIAIGVVTKATNSQAIAIGNAANAAGQQSVAIGTSASSSSTATDGISIGASASTTGVNSIGIGIGANVTGGSSGSNSIAIGNFVNAQGANSVSIGDIATSSGASSVAIGFGAGATATTTTSLGFNAQATGSTSTAIGASSAAGFAGATAIGYNSAATTINQIVLGTSAEGVYVPGTMRVVGAFTNNALTASSIVAANADKSLGAVTIGEGLTYSSGTLTATNLANQYDPVTTLTYDGVETTVMLVNGNSGRTFLANITKNTTLRFTNFWNGALTNASRPCDIGIRQDSVGTWTIGTQLTNALVAFGVGGTNLGIRSNATSISWASGRTLMFTNSMMQLSVVTNSVP